MKKIFLAIILVIGAIFFLLAGERTSFATTGMIEKTRVKIISGFDPIKSQIFANGGESVNFIFDGYFDCQLVIDVINIKNQRGNVTGLAIPRYAVVIGGSSEKFPVALWGLDSNGVTFPINNTTINSQDSSVVGVRLPTFGFVLSNGFEGFDSSKVLETMKNWDPRLYEEGQFFTRNWSGQVPDNPRWGVYDQNDKILAILQLVGRNSNGTKTTFRINKVFFPFKTLFGKKLEYIK